MSKFTLDIFKNEKIDLLREIRNTLEWIRSRIEIYVLHKRHHDFSSKFGLGVSRP